MEVKVQNKNPRKDIRITISSDVPAKLIETFSVNAATEEEAISLVLADPRCYLLGSELKRRAYNDYDQGFRAKEAKNIRVGTDLSSDVICIARSADTLTFKVTPAKPKEKESTPGSLV